MSAHSALKWRVPQPDGWIRAICMALILTSSFVLLSFVGCSSLAAQASASEASEIRKDIPIVELRSGDFTIKPAKGEARYLIDYRRALTANELLDQLDRFSIVQTAHLGYGSIKPGKPNIWFHFRVRNTEEVPGEWVVNFNRPKGTIEVEAFRSTDGGSTAKIFSCVPGTCTAVPGSPFISGLLELEPGETTDVLIGQPHRFSSQSPVTFATPQSFARDLAARDNRIWAMNGIWIAFVAVSLLMGSVIGWRLALAYSAYSAAALLLFGLAEGTLPLIPESFVIPFAEDFLLQFGLIFLVNFIRQFFRSHKNFPRLDFAAKVVIWASIINLVVIALGFGTWARVITQILILTTHVIQSIAAYQAARAGWHGAIPVLAGAIIIISSAYFDLANKVVPGLFERNQVLEISHAAFLVEALLFAVAIVLMVLALQRERDRALRDQLKSAEEKLRLDRELELSRTRFNKARKDAESSRQQIEAIGHDLMQPLGALRQALSRRNAPSDDEQKRLEIALGLIEDIARSEENLPLPGEEQDQVDETFQVGLIVENVFRMFAEDASSKGTPIRTVPCSVMVRCDPVALMRIVSNLVSNALRHAHSDRILIGCRRSADAVRLEVHDNGRGMSPDALRRALEHGDRAVVGNGQGLGLAIIQSLCDSNGLLFTSHTEPRKGMSFGITIPRA